MIISHKYKFLFIGLPFSASSAISKELYEQYEGEPFLGKHSLHHEFLKKATVEEKKYFVFAVLRNPMEIVVTVYEKMRINNKETFTNPKLFKENGGYITKKHLERFKFIQEKNATFQEYFLQFYTKPYDNLSSITLDKCDYIIRYENMGKDYITALNKAGVINPRPLPLANKTQTKSKDLKKYYTDEIKSRAIFVFGPFLQKYDYSFFGNWGEIKPSFKSKILFKIMGVMRKINKKYIKHSKNKSITGTIYGEMQKKQES